MNTLLFTKKKKDVICQFQSLHIPMLNIGIQFLLKWYRNLIFWELLVILRHRKSKNVSLFRKIRGLSKTMSNICDGVFCKNILRLKTFSAKIFILYVWQGPKKVSDYPTKKNSSTAWKGSIFGVSVVRIFPQSNWIWRDTPYISVFSPIARKYVPEKLRIRKLSTQSSLLDRDINRCRQ